MARNRILIADDSEINRLIIKEMLENEYEIVEAGDGEQALATMIEYGNDIDLLLLDLNMPGKNGFDVLEEMNQSGTIKDIPVIIISAEEGSAVSKKAFDLGVEDFIKRPFDPHIVSHRIKNAIRLHTGQKQMMDEITDLFYVRERQNDMMVSILSNIVEYRNGESGAHVLHINVITGMLLEALRKKTNQYELSNDTIDCIRNASSFHDIGKIGIPSEILNKPARLTAEEFNIIKTHPSIGRMMMDRVSNFSNEPLVKFAKEICNWHHERWDGHGYPDGLKGDEIPISAQVVSMADVYDALTSVRCYKSAFTHEEALNMIRNGECGVFNPLLLECLTDIAPQLKEALQDNKLGDTTLSDGQFTQKLLAEIRSNGDSMDVSRNIRMLRDIKVRQNIFADVTSEAWIGWYINADKVQFNRVAQDLFGLPENIDDPEHNEPLLKTLGEDTLSDLQAKMYEVPEGDTFDFSFPERGLRFIGKTLWTTMPDRAEVMTGAMAKIIKL